MKKILITARHPGPLEATIGLIHMLEGKFEIILLVTDSAYKVFLERYSQLSSKITVFVPGEETFIKINTTTYDARRMKTEFSNNERILYLDFYRKLRDFINTIRPDFGIRTTPVGGLGVDEILPSIFYELFNAPVYCYQEYFFAGQGFEIDNKRGINILPKIIFTVDSDSVIVFTKKGLNAKNLGWLTHRKFKLLPDYVLLKKQLRNTLHLKDEEIILYACNATGDMGEELKKCRTIIKSIKKYVAFSYKFAIKFHPRHTSQEIDRYCRLLRSMDVSPIILDESFSYSQILAVSNYIISFASYLNIESLAYQASWISKRHIINMRSQDITFSIYIYDTFTKSLFKKNFSKNIIPSHKKNNGSLIITDARKVGLELNNIHTDTSLKNKILLNSYSYINSTNVSKFIQQISSEEV